VGGSEYEQGTLNGFLLAVATQPEDYEGLSLEEAAAKYGLDQEKLECLRTGTIKEVRVEVVLELRLAGEMTTLSWIHVWIHAKRKPKS
jgi:hypothetical protein